MGRHSFVFMSNSLVARCTLAYIFRVGLVIWLVCGFSGDAASSSHTSRLADLGKCCYLKIIVRSLQYY